MDFYLTSCLSCWSLVTTDLRLLCEGLGACVCGDNNLSGQAGDTGWGRWGLGSSTGLELS